MTRLALVAFAALLPIWGRATFPPAQPVNSSAVPTNPAQTGMLAGRPSQCVTGPTDLDTYATAGENLHDCAPTPPWMTARANAAWNASTEPARIFEVTAPSPSSAPASTLPTVQADAGRPTAIGAAPPNANIMLKDANGNQSIGIPLPGGGISAQSVSQKLAETVSVKDFGAVCDGTRQSGTDNAAAVLAAIAAVHPSGTILFPAFGCGGKGYVVGPLGTLTKIVTLDLGGSPIYPKANGVPWLTIGYALPNGHMVLKNGNFSAYAGFTPTDVIVLDQPMNTAFEHMVFGNLESSHAIVWHKAGYGSVFSNVQFNSNNAPSTIYYSYYLSAPGKYYTLNSKIVDSDFSGVATGRCIGIEGGELSIQDTVIESCGGGGIERIQETETGGNAMHLAALAINRVHFENNKKFNLKLAASHAPNYFRDNVTITASTFTTNPNNTVLYLGGNTTLVFTGNWVDKGCIDGDPVNLHGQLIMLGTEVQAVNPACDPSSQYLLSTGIANAVSRLAWSTSGNYNTQNEATAKVPFIFRTLDSTVGAKVVSFRNPSGAEVAYVTADGSYTSAGAGYIGTATGIRNPNTGQRLVMNADNQASWYAGGGSTLRINFGPVSIASGFGTHPTISGSGGGGAVTVGSGATAKTGVVTFSQTWVNAPYCVAQNTSTLGINIQPVATPTTLTLNAWSSTTGAATPFGAGDVIVWNCTGR